VPDFAGRLGDKLRKTGTGNGDLPGVPVSPGAIEKRRWSLAMIMNETYLNDSGKMKS
jgi:hypothetical protein